MGFWKNLNDELLFRGMSRAELSELTGIKADTINKSIARDSDVSAVMALKIAEKLSISLENLLGTPTTMEERINKIKSSEDSKTVYEAVAFISKYSDFLRKFDALEDSDKKILKDLTESLFNKSKNKSTVLNYNIGKK